jgi:hypothetical protein
MCSAPLGFQKRGNNHGPFRRKLARRRLVARLAIPITGIIAVTFQPMQIGVNPGAVRTLLAQTMSWALSQASLPAHHNATSAAASLLGGFLLDRLRLNCEGVIEEFSRGSPECDPASHIPAVADHASLACSHIHALLRQ